MGKKEKEEVKMFQESQRTNLFFNDSIFNYVQSKPKC